jgi:hypothetical protein
MQANTLSQYRQRLHQLLEQIERLAFRSARDDKLIKGTPGEVFRKCGSKKCKCVKGPEFRHGPYPVIQIFKNGKQRQIAISKNKKAVWEQAKNYQKQMQYFYELKAQIHELENLVKEMIENRLEEWPT